MFFRMGINKITIQLNSCLEAEEVGVVESWDQEVRLKRRGNLTIVD